MFDVVQMVVERLLSGHESLALALILVAMFVYMVLKRETGSEGRAAEAGCSWRHDGPGVDALQSRKLKGGR